MPDMRVNAHVPATQYMYATDSAAEDRETFGYFAVTQAHVEVIGGFGPSLKRLAKGCRNEC